MRPIVVLEGGDNEILLYRRLSTRNNRGAGKRVVRLIDLALFSFTR